MIELIEKIDGLMREEQFEEADCLMAELLASDVNLTKAQRNRLICDRVFCFTLGKSRAEGLEELLTKDFLIYMRKAKKDLALIRMEYAYALLIGRNIAGMNAARLRFEALAGNKHYLEQAKSERVLMRIADKYFLARHT